MRNIKIKLLLVLPLLAAMGCASEKQTAMTSAAPPITTAAPAAPSQPAAAPVVRATKDVITHDPVMAKHGNTYYLFSTGRGISVWSSKDLQTWTREKPIFTEAPTWAVQAIPGFKDNHIWAPDISFHNGKYYLYYSISAFGKNTSAIGLATNTTLNPQDPNFKWVDHGKVIQSVPGVTNWNAIDPNIITDENGTAYMSFGSFWGGLKLVKLSSDRKSVAEDIAQIPTIASRRKGLTLETNPPPVPGNPADAGGNAIEAPFIFRKNGYYYLFASIDYCCKGAKSDYKMVVGRAKDHTWTKKERRWMPAAELFCWKATPPGTAWATTRPTPLTAPTTLFSMGTMPPRTAGLNYTLRN